MICYSTLDELCNMQWPLHGVCTCPSTVQQHGLRGNLLAFLQSGWECRFQRGIGSCVRPDRNVAD